MMFTQSAVLHYLEKKRGYTEKELRIKLGMLLAVYRRVREGKAKFTDEQYQTLIKEFPELLGRVERWINNILEMMYGVCFLQILV